MNCCLVPPTLGLEHAPPGKSLVLDRSVVLSPFKKAPPTFVSVASFLQSSRQRRGPDAQLVEPCSKKKGWAPTLCRQSFVIPACFHLKLIDRRQFHGSGLAVSVLRQFCKISIAKSKLSSVTVIEVNIFGASVFNADFRYCNLKLFVNWSFSITAPLKRWKNEIQSKLFPEKLGKLSLGRLMFCIFLESVVLPAANELYCYECPVFRWTNWWT